MQLLQQNNLKCKKCSEWLVSCSFSGIRTALVLWSCKVFPETFGVFQTCHRIWYFKFDGMARMFKIEKKTWWNQNFSTSRMYFWAISASKTDKINSWAQERQVVNPTWLSRHLVQLETYSVQKQYYETLYRIRTCGPDGLRNAETI